MIENYMLREFINVTLPLEKHISPIMPEKVVLIFPDVGRCDIGALCYSRRKSMATWRKSREVDSDSIIPHRIDAIKEIINIVSDEFIISSVTPLTLSRMTKGFIRFMDWCDFNGHSDVLLSQDDAVNACGAFINELKHKLRSGELKSQSAINLQHAMLTYMSRLFDIDLKEHLHLITMTRGYTPTDPPDERDVKQLLSICKCSFNSIATFIVESMPYPYMITMQDVQSTQERVWIFPTVQWMKNLETKNRQGVYNHSSGGLYDLEEIKHLYTSERNAKAAIRNAKKLIDLANSDPMHTSRLGVYNFAVFSFIHLFLANTGMNLQQLIMLEWDASYSTERVSHRFYQVKARSGNKNVYFEIQGSFLPIFKRFISLRNFILGGKEFKYLFFTFSKIRGWQPVKIQWGSLYQFNKQLSRVFDSIPNITSRMWRAFKSEWYIQNSDVAVTAMALQNTVDTVKKRYVNGSSTKGINEMSFFLEQLSKVTIVEPGRVVGSATSIGGCSVMHESNLIIPDCFKPESCLFCDKYVIHADHDDILKILGFRAYLNRLGDLGLSLEQLDRVHKPILERLSEILNQISGRGDDLYQMVKVIDSDSESNQTYGSYWDYKIMMLDRLL
ncbi:hypothetical protein [Aeromonas popoffii]|uniref:hypothetical protein n=1 Tax=Aeromonas popoffii TaxID=70856 RepID=UPI0012ECD888|nr:hypothetical protein [Aeromonas popoffii]